MGQRPSLSGSRSHREQPAGGPGRRELDGDLDWASRIPHRRDVRIEESWPSVRSNRWWVERLHRRVIQVRFPESWSSTFSGEKAVLTHRPGYFCLDNAFALIEGAVVFENVGKVPPPATLVFGNLEK